MACATNRILLLAIVGVVFISGSQSANILGVFTSLSPSHLIVQMSMVKVLAENGHNVTVVTILKPPVTHKGINVLQLPLSDEDQRMMSATIGKMVASDNSNMVVSMFRTMGQMKLMFEKMRDALLDQRVKNLYENKDNKFDLVVIGYFLNNYQLGIAHKLKVPVILAATMPPNQLFNKILGNPQLASHVPAMPGISVKGQPMTFSQRLKNYITTCAMGVFMWILENNDAKDYRKVFGDDPNMPPYEDLAKNVSLTFFSSHAPSEGPIRPNVPAIVEVGGIQIKDKPDELPKTIADFLSDAKDGAILLCLGSNVKGAHLKPDTVQNMFNVLSKLKQKVIWKWEDLDKTPGKSDNILYSKWLPQDDILAHPKIKLFITHAGKGGITEAQYHGKPMLALPVFGDQPDNAKKMVKDGFGLSLSLATLEEQPFHEAILEVLNNPQYSQKVQTFSSLYRDRPISAHKSVLYWTEYVLRYNGAPHLQSPLVHMNYISANNLDVYGLLITILLVFIFVSKVILTKLYRKLFGKAQKTKKIKKS
ncbi:UDP-glucuronosyltransferase 1-1-like [Drosophila novamexicana]|uniref:UDP-glucuronosyltransferase 1-1-like n=1 Tax=Drosophila novamexicana TaxID=47314 RepID=UPI0011E591B7|nr:UDP-glucuronosyltransferase 1-1-like [Drosophila novamexicana]